MGGNPRLPGYRPVTLGEMKYQIKLVDLTGLPPAERLLSAKEKAFYQTLKFPKRRAEWLGGRFALKQLLLPEPGADLTRVEVLPSASGKPVVYVDGSLYTGAFSITHSHGWAAAGMSEECRFLGIDLEKVEHRISAWAEDFFHPQERTRMDDEFLTALWTKKEAVVKLLGTGLSLNSFDVRFVQDKVVFYGPALEVYRSLGGPDIKLEVSPQPEGFMLCVAYAR